MKDGATAASSKGTLRGQVYGGQQPISGAAIHLYRVGTTGAGSAATDILTSAVTSDNSGNFSLSGLYQCDDPLEVVYLAALGGDAGAGTNSAIAQVAALGECGSLSASTFINVNELTTAAFAMSARGYVTSASAVGSSSGDSGLATAFMNAQNLVSTTCGSPLVSSSALEQLNLVGNILAECVNSAGPSSTTCSTLLGDSTDLGHPNASDTLAAALYLVLHPAQHVADLYGLVSTHAPFTPSPPTQPSTFSVPGPPAPVPVYAREFALSGNMNWNSATYAPNDPTLGGVYFVAQGPEVYRLLPELERC